jgi:predicted nucleic acid-binding protein
VQGFLLDCNHLEAYYRRVPSIVERLKNEPVERWAFACVITLGEVAAGHRMTKTTDQIKRDKYEQYINENFVPYSIPITDKTRTYYAEIMGRIWEKHPPPTGKDTEKYLIQNGVDLNDVWFVACAWEHNITAVTNDDMKWIKEAVDGDVRFENWLEPSQHPLVKWVES